MFKSIQLNNEIISLTLMLLLVIALVAGQADATIQDEVRAEAAAEAEVSQIQPIYRQLRDRVVAMILEGVLADGDALPSVRNVAAEYRLNPLTVLKGYQELVDEELVEKKRGRGMFVNEGARTKLLKTERQRFLDKEWPKVRATIDRLGLDEAELLRSKKPNKDAGVEND